MSDRTRLLIQGVVIFIAYFLTGWLGLRLNAVEGFATLIWAPSGIAFASLLLAGSRIWPWVGAAAFVLNWSLGAPILSALGIAVGNTLEPVLAASFLRKRFSIDQLLSTLNGTFGFIGVAALGSTIVAATVGVFSLWLSGIIESSMVIPTWSAWWLGDLMGVLVVAPVLLVWRNWKFVVEEFRERAFESFAFLAVLALANALAFSALPQMRPYLVFPILLGAGVRFGPHGVTLTTFTAMLIAIVHALQGRFMYASLSVSGNLFELQIYIGMLAATGLILASAMAEKNRAFARVEHALAVRDDFLSIASHELKTPLTSLTLNIHMIEWALGNSRNDKALTPDKLHRLAVASKRQANHNTAEPSARNPLRRRVPAS